MREKLLLKFKKSMLTIGFMLVMTCMSIVAQAQQCAISGPVDGCVGAPGTFTVSGTGGAASARWSFNGNTTPGQSPSASYNITSGNPVTGGTVTVTLYDAQGNAICTASVPYTIHALPVAQFILANNRIQCFENNDFEFINQSSNPSGNPIVKSFWSFGDGSDDTKNDPNAKDNQHKTYTTAVPPSIDIEYKIILEVTDDKGCINTIVKDKYVKVKQPMLVNFTSNNPRGCDSVFAILTNKSNIPYDSVKSFYWEWLDDGKKFTDATGGCDSGAWNSSSKWIKANGSFTANLVVESNYGCKETFNANSGTNVIPNVAISSPQGDNLCMSENSARGVQFVQAPIPNLQSFLWNFDDPDSGPLNTNNQTLTPIHVFTNIGIWYPSLTVDISGCTPRTAIFKLLIKGPLASIERKPGSINFDSACNFDIIPYRMRYQCYIKDTVFFPNHSTYFLNDNTPFNDIANPGKPEKTLYTEYTNLSPRDTLSTIKIYDTTLVNIAKRNIHDPNYARAILPPIFLDTFDYIVPGYIAGNRWRYCDVPVNLLVRRDSISVFKIIKLTTTIPATKPGCAPLVRTRDSSALDYKYLGKEYVELTAGQLPYVARTNQEATRVWDFADDEAPRCTTDSRPIYPKSAANNNLWMSGPPGNFYPKNTYGMKDGHIFWVNCRYSNDSLPKHMYTPGKEQCYSVRLRLEDLSPTDTNVISMTDSKKDPQCISEGQVQLALQKPDASHLIIKPSKQYCFNNARNFGVITQFDSTQPSCDREFFWIHWDSAFDRIDATPSVFDRWIPQTGTSTGQNFLVPWPLATLGLPPNTSTAFNEYFTGGTYPTAISDPRGFATLGFKVQNGKDPVTGQPCIDEKWYHNAVRFITTDARFYFPDFSKADNPNPVPLPFAIGCPPEQVNLTRHPDAIQQDSIVQHTIVWGDNSAVYDTFNRWVCNVVPNKCISYKKTIEINKDGSSRQIDSLVTMIYNTITKQVEFAIPEDSIPTVDWQHLYTNNDRMVLSHSFNACQRIPDNTSFKKADGTDSLVITKSCCAETRSGVVIMGFLADLQASDTIICRGDTVKFEDFARYWLLIPPPGGPDYDTYDYWLNPDSIIDPNTGTLIPRNIQAPYQKEKIGFDFDDGQGMQYGLPDNPTYKFNNPGKYDVTIEFTDSTGCKILYKRTVWVSGIQADFDYTIGVNPISCRPFVKFADSSKIFDPCFTYTGGNVPCDYSDTILWDFGDNSQKAIYLDTVSHLYEDFGDYDVNLFVTTTNGCKDSITKTIVLEGPKPKLTNPVANKGCVPFSVEFVDKSKNPTPNANYTYYFGDGGQSSEPTHTYTQPGTYKAVLQLKDSVPIVGGTACTRFSDSIEIIVYPTRVVDIAASDTILCPNEEVTLFATNKTDPAYTQFKWEFGDGESKDINGKQGDTVTHKYKKSGYFFVTLNPSYVPTIGEPVCNSYDYLTIYVSEVQAKIDTFPGVNKPPFFYFGNSSTNAVEYWWRWDNTQDYVPCVTLPDCPNSQYNYGTDKGEHVVSLVARNEDGCYDTAYLAIFNDFSTDVNIPNVFTPSNSDALNDNFDIYILNEELYDLKIFNRWGELVFKSDNQSSDWNGKKFNTGNDCPAGEYFVTFVYRLKGEDKEKTYTGTVTLIRQQ